MRGALALVGFLALGWLAILLELAPLGGRISALPAPDLLFCVAAAAVVRPGRKAPAVAVFLLGLVRDALGGGPLGVGALALTVAVEGMRASAVAPRPLSFLGLWVRAVLWAAAAAAFVWLLLLVALAPAPALSDIAARVGLTALAYPVVALCAAVVGLAGERPAQETQGLRIRRIG